MQKEKDKKYLHMRSSVATLSIKVYDEQIPDGIEKLKMKIKNIPKDKWQVLAIIHDRDENSDSFYKIAREKRHIHIIVRVLGNRTKVQTILNALGVVFREGIDDIMWREHGVETIANFPNMAMYITHDTEQAINEAKEQYYINEIISNLTEEEIKLIREGYVRPSRVKVSTSELAELDKIAYQLGYELKSYNDWYSQWEFNIRTNAKKRVIEESYNRGVMKRISEQTEIMRLSIYLRGDANCGKSYACEHAYEGKQKLKIEGGGSGKYDNLNIDTEVILINDDVAPNLLNMSDNYICRAYRRNSNNPIWKGHYFVVTSNKEFDTWVHDCGIHNDANIEAARSRFYICHIDDNGKIIVDSYSKRGSVNMQRERLDEFLEFIKSAQQSIDEYNKFFKNKNVVDYSILNNFIYDDELADQNVQNFFNTYKEE